MISIITPVYNGVQYIDSCIKSVIAQSCPDVEHLIIDGRSSFISADGIIFGDWIAANNLHVEMRPAAKLKATPVPEYASI